MNVSLVIIIDNQKQFVQTQVVHLNVHANQVSNDDDDDDDGILFKITSYFPLSSLPRPRSTV